jgi:hypothetical protein
MIGTASSELVQPHGVHPGFDRPTRGFMHFVFSRPVLRSDPTLTLDVIDSRAPFSP